jgi:hypothetical protein
MNPFLTQVFAQAVPTTPINPFSGITTLSTLINWVVNLILIIGVGVLIVMLAIGFVRYITSQGDKTAVEGAQKMITYAAIGAVGLALVFALRTVIFNLLGLNTTTQIPQ